MHIGQTLQKWARRTPDASAILAPGRVPLTYGRLSQHMDDVQSMLRARGVGHNDRVALLLPDGPEMAVAFLTVAANATCAPLNPAYSPHELALYLADLRAKALIVQAGRETPARNVARRYGIPIIELVPLPAAAGLFTLTGAGPVPAARRGAVQDNEVALVLQTSGTTSRPKRVPLTHTNVCTSARDVSVALALKASDRCLHMLPLFHVHGLIATTLASLTAGASIVYLSDYDAPSFFAALAEFRPTWYSAVPPVHQDILTHAALYRETIAHCPLRFIRSSSAALPLRVHSKLESLFGAPVIVAYGMTEAAIQITCNPLPPQLRKAGSVGIAAGPEVAIMDEAGTVLPTGVPGEVVIRGANVFQGYENDPAANAQAFTRGWFRTGDQGVFDHEGYLFLTGRLKEMINRGGEKIAPQEVADVLMEHPAVAQAVAFAVPHDRLGEDVAAAVVLHPHAVATASDLRQFVMSRLAVFKVPQHVVIVTEIPHSPTGKPQRLGLAEQFGLTAAASALSGSDTDDAAPRTAAEARLAEIWTQVLGGGRLGRHDNFFQLGGDSLLATQLLSRVRQATGVEMSFRVFFETPTVAGMAQYVETASPPAFHLSAPSLPSGPQYGARPVSYAQQRVWILAQLGLGSQVYTLQEAMRLYGPLHVAALTQSLQEITRRHAIWRTTFTQVAEQLCQIIGPVLPFSLPVIELQGLPASTCEAQLQVLARQEVQRGFDLEQGPLIRATLMRLATEEHVLLLTMHHIVSDGWSQGVFWREWAALYPAYAAGQPSPLPELPYQYVDFTSWQRLRLQGERQDLQRAYWQRQLSDLPTLQLPVDHARPTVQSFCGARYPVAVSASLTQALKALGLRHGVTLFMTLLAALQTLLHRYTGQDDIPVGTLVANRPCSEAEKLIGFFVNTLVLRTDLSGDLSFQRLLERVREVALAAYEHQDLPFEMVLEALQPQRDLSRTPLFQVLFIFQNTPRHTPILAGLTLTPLEIDPETAKCDLTLELTETPEGLRGWFEYSTDVFERATIARLTEHWQTLLAGIIAAPEQSLSALPLLTEDERQRLLVAWNATSTHVPPGECLHQVFERQVAQTPASVAVRYGEAYLTYHELNNRANRVAHHLRALGVRPEMRVGLCLERSLDMVIGLLGILKAGAAYVPLDPAYPQERLAFMLANAQTSVLLTQGRLVAGLPEHRAQVICLDTDWPTIALHSDQNPVNWTAPDHVAYLLYTSGSTGRPKGVLGVHRAVLNALVWMWQTFPFAPHEVCCQKTSMSFGDFIQELLGPLLQGIPLVLIPDEIRQDPEQFVRVLAVHRITRLILVPSLLRMLLHAGVELAQRLPHLTLWIASGEALSQDLWERFRAALPHGRMINLYGTSEVSDDTTWYDTGLRPSAGPLIPIGRPIANVQVYVLDQHQQPVPIGVPGELYIGGAGVTRGYWQHPELTAAQFIPHPFSLEPGARLYKTGDLIRYLPDGTLEYRGRLDSQVKIRGCRLELGEIEAVLEQHPAVRQAVVVASAETPDETRLTAYLVVDQAEHPSLSALQRFLRHRVPAYMVPSAWVWLDALPLTPSGKVDRHALPGTNESWPGLAEAFVAPCTPTEEVLAGIWTTVLGVEVVNVHDNFFDLGGHSLTAVQVMARVRATLQVDIPLHALFAVPTVAGLALAIEAARQGEQTAAEPPLQPMSLGEPVPTSVAQAHVWLFDQILPGTPFFNLPYAMRLLGVLNVAVLEQSCNEIVRRHAALRTTFVVTDGQLVQAIAPTLAVTLSVEDLRAFPPPGRECETQRLVREEARQPFDLAHGPLFRIRLLRLTEAEHLLLITVHHIVSDGWSLGVLGHELAAVYDAFAAGSPSPLPALPLQYGDFVAWQHQWRTSALHTAQLTYWQHQLRPPLPVLDLAPHHPQSTALSFRTARHAVEFPHALCVALTRLSRQEGSTLFMVLLAAFKMLLHSYTGQEDLWVSTLVANRTRPETEGLIGLFMNTLLLRTHLGGNPTFREVLRRVRDTTLAAYTHQDLPFEDLLQTLTHIRRPEGTLLCPVLFVLQNARQRPVQRVTRTLCFLEVDQHAARSDIMATTFDIILELYPRASGLVGSCMYKTHLFEAATIDRMLSDFQQLLADIVCRPEQALSAYRARHAGQMP